MLTRSSTVRKALDTYVGRWGRCNEPAPPNDCIVLHPEVFHAAALED